MQLSPEGGLRPPSKYNLSTLYASVNVYIYIYVSVNNILGDFIALPESSSNPRDAPLFDTFDSMLVYTYGG